MVSEDLVKKGEILHKRLLAGDITAPAEIAEIFLPVLTEYLVRYHSNLPDPHWVDIAVTDTLLNYLQRPEQYDPNKANLFNYLKLSCRYDLYNVIKREKPLPNSVELQADNMEYKLEQDDSLGVEEEIIQKLSPTWNLIRDILPEQKDQEFLLMMMDGVRESTAFAILLNIVDLPKEEQAKIIKRHKDRIKKTILRHITSEELKKAK